MRNNVQSGSSNYFHCGDRVAVRASNPAAFESKSARGSATRSQLVGCSFYVLVLPEIMSWIFTRMT